MKELVVVAEVAEVVLVAEVHVAAAEDEADAMIDLEEIVTTVTGEREEKRTARMDSSSPRRWRRTREVFLLSRRVRKKRRMRLPKLGLQWPRKTARSEREKTMVLRKSLLRRRSMLSPRLLEQDHGARRYGGMMKKLSGIDFVYGHHVAENDTQRAASFGVG